MNKDEVPDSQQIFFNINELASKQKANEDRVRILELTIDQIDKRLKPRLFHKIDSNTIGYLRGEKKKCLEELQSLLKENKSIEKRIAKLNKKFISEPIEEVDEIVKRA